MTRGFFNEASNRLVHHGRGGEIFVIFIVNVLRGLELFLGFLKAILIMTCAVLAMMLIATLFRQSAFL